MYYVKNYAPMLSIKKVTLLKGLKNRLALALSTGTEPVFANVQGAQESIPSAYVACIAGRYNK
jgi:hypothetical protein